MIRKTNVETWEDRAERSDPVCIGWPHATQECGVGVGEESEVLDRIVRSLGGVYTLFCVSVRLGRRARDAHSTRRETKCLLCLMT